MLGTPLLHLDGIRAVGAALGAPMAVFLGDSETLGPIIGGCYSSSTT
jgi:hypothetical protein